MLKTAKILVVDDEPRLCDSMETLLGSQNYEVKTCGNGSDALHFLANEVFDLVLLDIYMEDMDGFEVIEKKIKQKIDTPVIIITGKASTHSAVKALKMGAVDYLKKPFEAGEIFGSIRKILTQRASDLRAERIYQQRRKMESLGRMAGSIAHHFNNQLSAVIGNLEIVLYDIPGDSEHRNNLLQAMLAANKAGTMSRQMLTYLGHAAGRKTGVDLSAFCRRTLSLIQPAIPEGMVLQVDLPASGPVIRADAGQIQLLLAHLITNAWESISDNQGTITLAIKTVSPKNIPSSPQMPIDWKPRDVPYACLEVSDTGCGIAAEDMDTLFDPFFTTKFIGRGLGLAEVAGIVKVHEGCITVESEPDRGSLFRVFFPVSTQKTIPGKEKPVASANKGETKGTVLLIENEQMVRKVATAMLLHLGYAVIEAKDGTEGVQQLKKHKNEICCVVSEMTLPRMNGWKTLRELRKLRSDVPVVLCSGYDEKTVMADGYPELFQVFLNKPYPVTALKHALLTAMGGHRREGAKR